MMQENLWSYSSYKTFMKAYIQKSSKEGRGQSTKLATVLGIHPSLLSQVVRGDRNLTLDQASLFCDAAGFSDTESNLFLRMVEFEKAGTDSLKNKLKKQITELKESFSDVKTRMTLESGKMSEQERSVFYSGWHYSAIRMMVSTGDLSTEEIAEALKIPRKTVKEAIEYMIATKLLVQEKGVLKLGPRSSHVEASSYWSQRHHLNWRVKNLTHLPNVSEKEVCFTAPFSCSRRDYKKIRELLLEFVGEISALVKDSPAEEVHEICIDLFNIYTHSSKSP